MMRNRIASIVPPSEKKPKPLVPIMAYEHVRQCLQLAQGRIRADAAVVMAVDQYERDRKRALAFVKFGALRPPTPRAAAQLAAEAGSHAGRDEPAFGK